MDKEVMEANITRFICELLKVDREGVDGLVTEMTVAGFSKSPCSGAYHLAEEGGLLQHSLNVLDNMRTLAEALKVDIPDETIILCALLHDLGKMGDHGKPNYTENLLKDGKQSKSKPYETNKDLLYLPHEVRSVMIAERYIKLTEEEEHAILCHNGLYGDFKYVINGKETPLYMLLHFADLWSARVTEVKDEENEG